MILARSATATRSIGPIPTHARQAHWAAVEEVANFAENYVRRGRATLQGFLEGVTL